MSLEAENARLREPEVINITQTALQRHPQNPTKATLDQALCVWFARLNGGENDVAIFKCGSHIYVGPHKDVCLATLVDYPQQLVTEGFSL